MRLMPSISEYSLPRLLTQSVLFFLFLTLLSLVWSLEIALREQLVCQLYSSSVHEIMVMMSL